MATRQTPADTSLTHEGDPRTPPIERGETVDPFTLAEIARQHRLAQRDLAHWRAVAKTHPGSFALGERLAAAAQRARSVEALYLQAVEHEAFLRHRADRLARVARAKAEIDLADARTRLGLPQERAA